MKSEDCHHMHGCIAPCVPQLKCIRMQQSRFAQTETAGDPDGDGEMILFYDHDKVLECLLESHLRVEWVCNDSRLSVKYVSSPR